MPSPDGQPSFQLALPPWQSRREKAMAWIRRSTVALSRCMWALFPAISQPLEKFNKWVAKKVNLSTKWFVEIELGFLFFLGLGMIQVDEYALAIAAWVVLCFIWASKAAGHEWNTPRRCARALKTSGYLLFILVCSVTAIVWVNIRRDHKEWTNFQKLGEAKQVANNVTPTPAPPPPTSLSRPTPSVSPIANASLTPSPSVLLTHRPNRKAGPSPAPTTAVPMPTSTPEADLRQILASGRLSRGWTLHKRRGQYSIYYILNTEGLNHAVAYAMEKEDVALDQEMSARVNDLWKVMPTPKRIASDIGEIKDQEPVEHVVHWFGKDILEWNCEIMSKDGGIGGCPSQSVAIQSLSSSNRETVNELDRMVVRAVNKRYIDALEKVSQ